MTPQEWRNKTVSDIEKKRKLKLEGEKQAKNYSFENMKKVQRRLNK
ncbi:MULTISPECIES: hypothetical protein [unclassified Clostridium]|nr:MULTISPECIES: hypothetical protein [unclassified Clostridium]EKQ52419.1 MAG: hypothetical protein A370_04252 [Clostridium sp. Maddingley MBC34-26]